VFAAVLAFVLAAPAAASARTWVVSYWWSGYGTIGTYYVSHPHKIGFKDYPGYWFIRDAHWRNWGYRRTRGHGRMASGNFSGTPVHIRLFGKRTYYNCRWPGDKVHFYTRASVRRRGQLHWHRINRTGLYPQCNNP
jgi:hypothetical protein